MKVRKLKTMSIMHSIKIDNIFCIVEKFQLRVKKDVTGTHLTKWKACASDLFFSQSINEYLGHSHVLINFIFYVIT